MSIHILHDNFYTNMKEKKIRLIYKNNKKNHIKAQSPLQFIMVIEGGVNLYKKAGSFLENKKLLR